jgi:uncharacterized membrane protein YbhN (UPF0104 family)
VLFVALLALVDLRRLWAAVAGADGPLLVASLAVAGGAIVLLEALRFQVAFAGWGLGYGAALRITLAGLFVGSFTPGAVGAEVYKLYAVRRGGMIQPLVRLTLLRAIGALAVAVAAAAAWLAAPGRFLDIAGRVAWRWPRVPLPVLAAGGAALAVAGLAVMVLGWGRLVPRVRRALRQGWQALAEIQLRQVGKLAVLSLGIALLRGLSLALLVRSFGERARWGDLLVVVAFSVLASTLPISPAGLGVQEGVLAGCLVLLRIPPPAAVAIALVNRAFLWLFAVCGGWALAVSRRAPLRPAADEVGGLPLAALDDANEIFPDDADTEEEQSAEEELGGEKRGPAAHGHPVGELAVDDQSGRQEAEPGEEETEIAHQPEHQRRVVDQQVAEQADQLPEGVATAAFAP